MKRNHRRINKKIKPSPKKYADNRYISQEGTFLEGIVNYIRLPKLDPSAPRGFRIKKNLSCGQSFLEAIRLYGTQAVGF